MDITADNKFSLLRSNIEAFCKLSETDWQLLLPHLEIKTIKKNELFIAEGKRGFEVAFVIDGMFRQFYTKEGEEKLLISFLKIIS